MAARRTMAGSRTAQARKGRAPQTRAIVKREIDFPVVAIGASAGGLDAMRSLFTALPTESGMAFIVVLHLDPTHPSKLVELLSAYTAMTILEAREAMLVQPDHVYVIPPGRFLTARGGALHLAPAPGGQSVRMPFDFLLRSLAEAIAERAVCIILSGTATDGSAGAEAIKEMGGLVIAQNPEEAEYDGMPRSAIATGAVDLVLPLARMPEALAEHAGHRYVRPGKDGAAHPLAEEGVTKIIDLLRKKTSHDFALYKQGTLVRRIERRMAMAGVEDTGSYLTRLAGDPAELQNLANDLLINVTRFFRDAAPKERESETIAARSGSILIVEDDPAVRLSLEELLRADGHRVTAAADDEEAVELVTHKNARPDIVIVDYDLPEGVTGLHLMTRLRRAMGRDVPALVLTGDIAIATLSEISRQGYAHRSKPIRAIDLTRFIRSLLVEQPESSPKDNA